MRKKPFSFLFIVGFIPVSACMSQTVRNPMNGPPVLPRDLSAFQNIVNINGQDGYYLKKDLYLTTSYTIINGQKVMGIPFLFMDWYPGSLTTADGRKYNDYKLKYNAENQTIHFLNGSDSLEVNEEIKEFSLRIPMGDTMITSRFIHSNQVQKSKSFYYEVLLDNEQGQLLKTNEKIVAAGDATLVGYQKYLKLESSYFYYDKTTRKLTRLKTNGNIPSILKLSEEETKELPADALDLSNEAGIISIFKKHFEKSRLKAF